MNWKILHFIVGIIAIGGLGGFFGARSSGIIAQISMQNLQKKTNIMPVVVIGSGPAGLPGAMYSARGGKDTFVIEGNKPGGLLMDTTDVANWPGEVSIKGPEIIDNLRKQAVHQGVRFISDAVERIDTSHWPYVIHTENGVALHALSIIIATGATPRKLGVPGEEKYWGSGVTSCAVCDAPFYKDDDVVVVGGGDSAIEEAIQLASYAKKITILVRKDRMRAAAGMQDRLNKYDQIGVQYNVDVRKILGDGDFVTGVELYNNKTGQTSQMTTNGVFLAVGHDPNSQFVKGVVQTDPQGYITVKARTQETSVPGVFAAGDVVDHRYRQAGTSAGSGIAAGLDAVKFLDDIGFTIDIATQIKPDLFGATRQEQPMRADSHDSDAIENMDQFKDIISQKGVVVFDFWAETCPSCKQMLPVFRAVSQEFAGKATFITVDTDVAQDVAQELFVHRIPCVLIFRDGGLVARYTNAMSRKELATLVQQVIDGDPVAERTE